MKTIYRIAIILLFLSPFKGQAQCVVFNELIVRGIGACDGSCNPSTSEWIELYNSCGTPTDISCYVMTDGEFYVTIPTGTIMAPYSFYVIGSSNSGGAVDLDLGTCGCGGGIITKIGTLTNPGDQLVLTDATGAVQDAIIWGGGQSGQTDVIISTTAGTCPSVSVNLPLTSPLFEDLVTQPANGKGCSVARVCDGSMVWENRCTSAITMGTTNGAPVLPQFSASDTTICPGTCIDFADSSKGTPTNWAWTFAGAGTATSAIQNPTGICYNTPGNFDVKLVVTNGCGSDSMTKTGYIQVSPLPVPVITSIGSLAICPGDSVVLNTTSTDTLQWFINGTAISGATTQQYIAKGAGRYNLTATNATGCADSSNSITVTLSAPPVVTISAGGPVSFCPGDSVALSATTTFTAYQWYLNGSPLTGDTLQTYQAKGAGDYSLIAFNGGCSDTSNIITVTLLSPTVTISPAGPVALCTGDSVTLTTATTFTTYQWNLNSSPIAGETNQSFTAKAAGDYTLDVTSGACSATSNVVTVTISSSPTVVISAAGPVTFCAGSSVTLSTASTFTTYQWNLNSSPIAGETNQSYTATAAGDYTLDITSGSCTGTSNLITVTVSPSPTATITPQGATAICPGGTVVLDGGAGFTTYEWWLNGAPITGATNQTDTATVVGDYQLIVTNSNGCADTSAILTVTSSTSTPPTITSSTGNFTICAGQPLTLSVPNTYSTYQWLLNGSPISGATASTHSTSTAGDYSVGVISTGGCADTSAVVTLTVQPSPTAAITPTNPPPACDTDPIALQGSGGTTYEWLQNNSPIAGQTNDTYQASTDGSYSVVAINAAGCRDTSVAVNVQFFETDTLSISGKTSLCEGDSTVLSITGTFAAINWSTGETDPAISAKDNGTYSVTVMDINGCTATDAVTLTFNAKPTADAGPDVTVNCTDGYPLAGSGTGTYTWIPAKGLDDPGSATPLALPDSNTIYKLVVTNGGCSDTDEVSVTVKCILYFAPSAFSPNGDGINEIFTAYGPDIATFDMKIFDRWGEMIYSTKSVNQGWDGTYKGRLMGSGVYVWLINATNHNGKTILFNGNDTGDVMLLR